MFQYPQANEKDLLLLLQKRDHAAFNEIYSRTWKKLYQTAYQRLRDEETCKDIVHDVFADLWNKKDAALIQNLQAYLSTAVRYKIYSRLASGYHSAHFVEPLESMAQTSETAETWFEFKELEYLISLWIDTLPRKRKEIFQLRYLENLSTRDISLRLNISQKTVQNQLLLASNDLQAYLKPYLPLLIALASVLKN